ncbi:aggregation-promoting factor C-terminal-like domain-containing protein [Catellatospora vulcania]|uniref:aggregation-promoting factor C-terminal-like domain-containing protein n=1 Tax=Catellatospora vulcania TaxID=1460450 RepID=UPI001E4E781A|nr:transglycosylase SLT domain-containing protein [Catellatospora vulcania]
MSRQRRAPQSAHPATGRLIVRSLAVLTLLGGVAGAMRLDETAQWQADALTASHQAQVVAQAESAALTLQQHQLLTEAKDRAAAEAKAAAARAAAVEKEVSRRGAARTTPVDFGPIPKSCQEFSGNRAIGCALVLAAGMDLTQMACLNKLWTRESGWNHKAENKSSGAYGIPQSLPGTKMATFGADWRTNPATQIKWGLDYIKKRYSTPCKAWQHSEDAGWY